MSRNEKIKFIRLIEGTDMSVSGALAQYDGPRSTYYRWKRHLKAMGTKGLEDNKPHRARTWNQLLPDQVDKMLEYATFYPESSCSLRRATSAPKLLELDQDPDQILPGYGELVRRWSQRRQQVLSDRLKSRMAEQERKRRLRAARGIPISFDVDATLRDLSLDAVSQSESEELQPGDAESAGKVPHESRETARGNEGHTSDTKDDKTTNGQRTPALLIGSAFGLGAVCVALLVAFVIERGRRQGRPARA